MSAINSVVKATTKSSPKISKGKQTGTIANAKDNATAKVKTAPKKTTKGKVVKFAVKENQSLAYADVAKSLNGKLSDVKPIKLNGETIALRRFHLPPEAIKGMREEYAKNPKVFPNPHNKGLYFYLIDSLVRLGKDKAHSYADVKSSIRTSMSAPETKDDDGHTSWQRYIGKEMHTDDTDNAKNVDGKLHQNAEVLQRLGGMTPYGLKLWQVGKEILKTKGCVIDILKSKDGKDRLYRLNTDSAKPQNDFKRTRS